MVGPSHNLYRKIDDFHNQNLLEFSPRNSFHKCCHCIRFSKFDSSNFHHIRQCIHTQNLQSKYTVPENVKRKEEGREMSFRIYDELHQRDKGKLTIDTYYNNLYHASIELLFLPYS